jgi:hypothetical protein
VVNMYICNHNHPVLSGKHVFCHQSNSFPQKSASEISQEWTSPISFYSNHWYIKVLNFSVAPS